MIERSEAQIVQKIEELLGDISHNFKTICEYLAKLPKHYLHRDPMFKNYKEVANGKLIPEVVMAMAKASTLLPHICGRPPEVQRGIASDNPISWLTVEKGQIVERRGSWRKMATTDFKRMFPIGGAILSLSEQRAAIEQEMSAKPVTHIRQQPIAKADTTAGTFKLGTQTVPLSVIISALREAGVSVPA
jgi:hypothetical protein